MHLLDARKLLVGFLGACVMTGPMTWPATAQDHATEGVGGSISAGSPTVTRLSASSTSVRRGDRVTLTAKVTTDAGGRVTAGPVTFWVAPVGQPDGWRKRGSADLTKKGTARKRIKVTKTTWFSAIYGPHGQWLKSWSAPVRVRVK